MEIIQNVCVWWEIYTLISTAIIFMYSMIRIGTMNFFADPETGNRTLETHIIMTIAFMCLNAAAGFLTIPVSLAGLPFIAIGATYDHYFGRKTNE